MDPLDIIVTQAGLDALVDAQNGDTDPIVVTEVGLTETAFDPAPTLTALPGEFKRIVSVAGQSVADNIIHMTAQDSTAATYDLRGFGLYLADGTLFATFGQAEPLFRKVSIAAFLLSFDLVFNGAIAGDIEFGSAEFLYPPATETVKGVARIATQARVDALADAGDDAETIVTPKTLRVRLAALKAAVDTSLATLADTVDAAIAALTAYVNGAIANLTDTLNAELAAFGARTITGGGLATGGGDLTADRVITVTEASPAEVAEGTDDSTVLTPRRAAVLLPAGSVFAFAMPAAPAGYLECNGAAVSRALYPSLYVAIGDTFGAGDGATTFNLPDLRGEFVRGYDNGRGIDAGRAFGSDQEADFAEHTHLLAANVIAAQAPTGANHLARQSNVGGDTEYNLQGTGTAPSVLKSGTAGGTETRPRNIALLYAIKT